MMVYFYYTYLLTLVIAFVCSIRFFKIHSLQMQVLSILLGVAIITECLARPFIEYLPLKNNNNPIYNSYILLECTTYLYFFYKILLSTFIKKLIKITILILVAFWVISTFYIFNFYTWNSYFVLIESLVLVLAASAYYYELFTSKILITLKTHPEFWIATGMLIYYSCNMPYLGTLNYLTKHYKSLSSDLLILLNIFNILMYLLFSYAFICKTIEPKY